MYLLMISFNFKNLHKMTKIILSISFFLLITNLFSQKVINMTKINGVYQVPCKVNGIPMNFIFDTGATNVSLSSTEASFLIKQGLISEDDFIGIVDYQIANGDIIEGTKINLKTIDIGGIILRNITSTIIHQQNAPLLLGQSVISKLGKYSIVENKLILENYRNEYSVDINNPTVERKEKGKEYLGNVNILDEKYGFKKVKFSTKLTDYTDISKIGETNNLSIYHYKSSEPDYKTIFNVEFYSLLLGFDKPYDSLKTITLIKPYRSKDGKNLQKEVLDDLDMLIYKFTSILGKPHYSEKELTYYWVSEKIILEGKYNTDKIELNDMGESIFNLSIIITYYKKDENEDPLKGF